MKRTTFLITNLLAAFAAIGILVAPRALAATLNQSSITVGLGQSATVAAQGSAGVYMLSNSSPTIVSVVTNGTQITVTGMGLGSATVGLCTVGSATDCVNLYVTVQSGSVGGLSFGQSSPSVGVGQTTNVSVSGGSDYYVSGNSNSAVASVSITSSTLAITGVASGSTSITVCSAANGCGTVSVSVNTSAYSSQAVVFSVTNPTLSVGQALSVALSGGATYFVINNSNANSVQATISGSTLALNGLSAGSSIITVCVAGGDCGTLAVTVTSAAQTPLPITTLISVPTPTPTPVPTQSSSADIAALLVAIQSTQSQLAQISVQIQALTNTLTQLVSKISVASQTSVTSAGATFSGTFTQYLTLGSEGAEVTALQNKLKTLGFYSGSATGYFGPLTEAAVKAYQSARGISALGYVGPSTRAALNGE